MAWHVLPLGIQTLREIRERNCYYVDKTRFAVRLAEEGLNYFLSRPRRFGKSLFVDTLKELFEGSRELFKGLDAYDRWDWSVRYPVIKLDFARASFRTAGYLHEHLMAQFGAIEEEAGIESRYETGPERFRNLIRTLHRRTGQRVAVLVDDYDKPVLDAWEEPSVARSNRDYLLGLYSTTKDSGAHICLSFFTGVSRFHTASLFSGLNNLLDLTLSRSYSAVCGYTEEDIGTVFAPELPGLDRERVRDWYNGYSWGGDERVYNPFSTLLLFRTREFKTWWFETGTPEFLVKTLVDRGVASPTLDGMFATDRRLSTFAVGDVSTEALLFRTGCLTVASSEMLGGNEYRRLGYPNREVRQSLNAGLLRYLFRGRSSPERNTIRLGQLLQASDFDGLERLFREILVRIPHLWGSLKASERDEGYYASVFYSHFAGLDQEVSVEENGIGGRLDMAVRAAGRVYLFEFKLVERAGPGSAMAQLKERRYADKYRHLGEPMHLVAVEFGAETRRVEKFETELA